MPGAFDDLIPQQAQSAPPAFIPGTPKPVSPIEVQRETRAQQDQAMQQAKFQRDAARDDRMIANDSRKITNEGNANANQLRDDFGRQPAVADYRKTISEFSKAMQSAPTPQGDLSLIYAFAKIMDPGSVVREGEQSLITNTSPIVDKIAGQFGKQVLEGGTFTEDARARLRNEMSNKMAEMNQGYLLARSDYQKRAESMGIDPFQVIGSHEGDAFAGRIRNAQADRGVDSRFIPRNADVSSTPGGDGVEPGERRVIDSDGNLIGSIGVDGTFTEIIEVTPMSQDERDAELAKERNTFGGAIDAIGRGIADTATLGFADELSAGFDTAFGDGTYKENLAKQRQIDRVDSKVNPWARLGGQITGGIAMPTGVGNALATGGVKAAAARAGMEGAAYGGTYGFGSGETMQDRGINALAGAATGAALGYGLTRGVPAVGNALAPYGKAVGTKLNALTSRGPVETVDAAAIAAAGKAENVTVNRAMVDPTAANKVTAMESTIGGGPKIRGGMNEVASQIEGRVSELGRGGQALDQRVAGEKLQGAAARVKETSKGYVDGLYTRARSIAGDPMVKPDNAVAAIDGHIAELSATKGINKSEIDYLKTLKKDVQSGLTIDAFRRLRTTMRGNLRERNLLTDQSEARAYDIIDAASRDIESTLAGNPRALQAYKTADNAHRGRVEYIKQVLAPILGKPGDALSPEKAFERFRSWASPKGDSGRMDRFWKSFTPEESRDVAATLAGELGRGADKEFSPALFISQAEKLSSDARRIAFGESGARSIDNLIELSKAHRRVTRSFNHSKSGVAINSNNLLNAVMSILGVAAGGSSFGMTGMAVTGGIAGGAAVKNFISAKLLMSPEITAILKRAPATTDPAAINSYWSRLERVASKTGLGAELAGFQQALLDSVRQSPGRASAGQQENNGRQEPPQ